MLNRNITRTQAIIALLVTAILAILAGIMGMAPAVPLPAWNITTALAMVVVPAICLTVWNSITMLCDPVLRDAARKNVDKSLY